MSIHKLGRNLCTYNISMRASFLRIMWQITAPKPGKDISKFYKFPGNLIILRRQSLQNGVVAMRRSSSPCMDSGMPLSLYLLHILVALSYLHMIPRYGREPRDMVKPQHFWAHWKAPWKTRGLKVSACFPNI